MRRGEWLPRVWTETGFKRYCRKGPRVALAGCSRFALAARKAMYGRRSALGMWKPVRSEQCLNMMGVRIWANKPRRFKCGGNGRFATVARFVELCEFRESRAWQREGREAFSRSREFHIHGFDRYCATATCFPLGLRAVTGDIGGDRWCEAGGPIDAPVLIAAGSFVADQQNGSYVWRAGK